MHEYDVKRCTRRCAKTDRELRPGELFYSALVADGTEVKRLDYAQDAWEEPGAKFQDDAIAWWKSHVPGGGRRTHWAPNDVLLDYFQRLDGDATKADVRYVLGLLMIRRRIVRLEDTEFDEAGGEVLVLYCPRNESEFRVPVVMPSDARATEIQAEFSQLLTTTAG